MGQDQYSEGRKFNSALLKLFFYRLNLRKITEMSSGIEECKIAAWARDKIFPSSARWVRCYPVRVAEFCLRSCYSVKTLHNYYFVKYSNTVLNCKLLFILCYVRKYKQICTKRISFPRCRSDKVNSTKSTFTLIKIEENSLIVNIRSFFPYIYLYSRKPWSMLWSCFKCEFQVENSRNFWAV